MRLYISIYGNMQAVYRTQRVKPEQVEWINDHIGGKTFDQRLQKLIDFYHGWSEDALKKDIKKLFGVKNGR